jgi:hypothetical protein
VNPERHRDRRGDLCVLQEAVLSLASRGERLEEE